MLFVLFDFFELIGLLLLFSRSFSLARAVSASLSSLSCTLSLPLSSLLPFDPKLVLACLLHAHTSAVDPRLVLDCLLHAHTSAVQLVLHSRGKGGK